MGTPSISILLPVRDGRRDLSAALDSLRRQTYGDFEVLVQDDGSSDGSGDIARDVARHDARFCVERQEALGIVEALNRAARRARGTLFVRMDADDVCRPERLERLWAAAAERGEVGFFSHRVRCVPDEAVGEGMRHYEAWLNSLVDHDEIVLNRFVECPLPHPSWALRREVFERLEGYRAGLFPEDYDFFLRAVASGVRFFKLEEVLLDWREGPDRLSRRDERYGLDRFRALKVAYLVPGLRRRGRPVVIAGAGGDGKAWARALTEAGLPPAFFLEVHPGRIGQVIHGVRVVGYEHRGALAGAFVLGAVGKRGAREDVRRHLGAAGLEEGRDFLCVQ